MTPTDINKMQQHIENRQSVDHYMPLLIMELKIYALIQNCLQLEKNICFTQKIYIYTHK